MKLQHTSYRELFMLDWISGREACAGWVQRHFLADTRVGKWRGKA